MEIKLHNTMTRSVEPFKPLDAPKVGLYTCGPTVYNFAHIGNLRTYVFEDILKRALTLAGFEVDHVMNVTDVGHLVSDADDGEDKMALGAAREGKSVWELADFYWQAFMKDLDNLNIIHPNVWCKATDHIDEQIEQVAILEEKGYTYKTADGIYFDTSKLDDYGKMTQLDIEGMQAGKRIDMGEKRNATDFALWKFSPKDQQRLMEWDSPWGVGFPGWHIECSAMAIKYLGERLDLHCGGIDHVSIHHTNEIAQAECALGHEWCNWWIHGEFLTMAKTDDGGGGKMSKSSGEFLTVDVLVKKGYDPMAYRYFLLNAHYRQQLAFSFEGLDAAANALKNLKEKVLELKKLAGDDEGKIIPEFYGEYEQAVCDDLNMPRALAAMWKTANDADAAPADKIATIEKMDDVLGLNIASWQASTVPAEILEILELRKQARQEKNWDIADKTRDYFQANKIEFKDLPDGSTAVSDVSDFSTLSPTPQEFLSDIKE